MELPPFHTLLSAYQRAQKIFQADPTIIFIAAFPVFLAVPPVPLLRLFGAGFLSSSLQTSSSSDIKLFLDFLREKTRAFR